MFSLLLILSAGAKETDIQRSDGSPITTASIPKHKSNFSWKSYGVGVGATAISVPIATVGASFLTKSSNQLVMGMLPPVLCGIFVPSTTAFVSSRWMLQREGKELRSSGWAYGATAGLGIGLFATQTAAGVSSDQLPELLVAGALNAFLLPLPTILMAKETKITTQLSVTPSQAGMVWSGGMHGHF